MLEIFSGLGGGIIILPLLLASVIKHGDKFNETGESKKFYRTMSIIISALIIIIVITEPVQMYFTLQHSEMEFNYVIYLATYIVTMLISLFGAMKFSK